MPLNLPNLDDRGYADLVEEGRALIPNFAAEWTDHNPSDPGITLIELFAYLTEMLMYRVNRVSVANTEAFLRLLNGPDWQRSPGKALVDEVREAVLSLRKPYRAVTEADYESLALAATPEVVRVRAVARRNLVPDDLQRRTEDKPAHVSVIVVSQAGSGVPKPSAELIRKVADALEPARLLTTRLHVMGPRYVKVGVKATLVVEADALASDVSSRAVQALRCYLDPLTGGPGGIGWPFGRNVYASEVYQLLDMLPGVDYVKETPGVIFTADPARLNQDGSVELLADELVEPVIAPGDIQALPAQKD